MNRYRADLHVHSVLSPCGDLGMSPANIVKTAARRGIDILGVTDHNSTRHGPLTQKLAEREGIFVLCGAEVATKEEIHCLAFFENHETLMAFQQYLDDHLPDVWNDPTRFGYQVVVDEQEMIVEEIDKLLVAAIGQSIEEVEATVHELGGLFIPAHVDRPSHGLFSQLGFLPPDLRVDAIEMFRRTPKEQFLHSFPDMAQHTLVVGSDAHYLSQLGTRTTLFEMKKRSFAEIRMALHGKEGRKAYADENTDYA